ncbi:hypothetical protein [Croceicoccus sp. YJ47]|uniref:hypothetical protein n=1 Tax=Croceicoccus sp. YJ47 TaxID=2798724 RepID=UPI001924986D|nr:hypothetical protein [Croceicoccus sp. YJ47]QQN73200.1 hypothetical protein JD971_10005 [Croceicoccus sp. YJ47]
MKPIPVLLLTAMLCACGAADDDTRPVESEVVADDADDGAALEPGDQSLADPAPGSVTAPADGVRGSGDGGSADATPMAIPASMRGRWGLTRNDCDGPASVAKGLLTIETNRLTFYESRGTLADVTERSDDYLRAMFAFVGEGMEWRRDMMLRREGDVLLRREFGPDAMRGDERYMRCA